MTAQSPKTQKLIDELGRRRTMQRSRPSGLTLVELLVAIFIASLLCAVSLSAVNGSRESARRLQCANNLRQIGTALSSFQSVHGSFPAGARPDRHSYPAALAALGPLSVHYQLLPYIEQTAAFNNINTLIDGPAEASVNVTIAHMRLSIFMCPSDFNAFEPGNDYRATVGCEPFEFDRSTPSTGGGGAFAGLSQHSPASFSDGLAATVGFSERVSGGGSATRFAPTRDIWFSGIAALLPEINNDNMLEACASLTSVPPLFWAKAGASWMAGRYADTLYNHVAPPNWNGSDCSADFPFGEPGAISGGAISARSFHVGGVNILFMDGSVDFARQSVDLRTWRARATRAGGEVVTADVH
jgi:prepilin-type processing-associated H-X9-DG protein